MGAPRRQTVPVDWPQLVLELRARGWTIERIATAIGVCCTTVSNWLGGATAEPAFSKGIELVRLHQQHVTADQAPLGVPMLSGRRRLFTEHQQEHRTMSGSVKARRIVATSIVLTAALSGCAPAWVGDKIGAEHVSIYYQRDGSHYSAEVKIEGEVGATTLLDVVQ